MSDSVDEQALLEEVTIKEGFKLKLSQYVYFRKPFKLYVKYIQ